MTKKYILKPGKHQFAPGSAAVHDNDNISDEEAEWYLARYPHIANLFAPQPPKGGAKKHGEEIVKVNSKKVKGVGSLTPPSGGKGGI